jgi:hypothetical protein
MSCQKRENCGSEGRKGENRKEGWARVPFSIFPEILKRGEQGEHGCEEIMAAEALEDDSPHPVILLHGGRLNG